MIRMAGWMRVAAAMAIGIALSSCSTWDLDSLFDNKKPLPGERKAVFPEGVPGVPQGVPRELVRGYQATPEAQAAVPEAQPVERPAETPAETPKPKPKPKARETGLIPVRPSATSITVQPNKPDTAPSGGWASPPAPGQASQQDQPAQQPAQQSAPAAAAAPATAPSAWPTPSGNAAPSPWPSAPPPGQFSR